MPVPNASRSDRRTSAARNGAAPALTGDLALVKEAIDLARKARTDEATATRDRIADPAAQKLVEWFILRHSETTANFNRYAAFIAANPDWPSAALLRRRAEARLWQERSDAATVRGFTGDQPVSARGKLALARILLGEGDRDGAGRLVRDAWRSEELSERVEAEALEMFRDLLTREDHRARMDRRIGAKDGAGAMRAAKLLGGDAPAIVKACAAVRGKSDKAPDMLGAVATEAREDLGYTLCRIQWLLAQNRIDDAARADAGRGARNHGAAGHRSMVARAALAGAQADGPGQVPDRLPGHPPGRGAGQRILPGRRPFHVRLDRPALPRRTRQRAGAFRPYRRGC